MRKMLLALVVVVVALGAAEGAAAQTYPSRPVRIIVGLAPGGTNDILARLIGQGLSEQLGQPFVVENRPGASGNIGTEVVVRSPPDGHTLLFTGMNNAINATLYEKLTFNFIRDIAPVASMVRQPLIMLVNPSVPAKTIPEFIAYAKANPGKLNMASPGTGTGPHVIGELFKSMTGVDMVHVPFRGGAPAMTGVIGGQVHAYFDSILSSIEYIKSGKVRPLAVTAATRSDTLPDIPPMNDFVPGFEASAWFGIGAPKGTPVDIVEKLNRAINATLGEPEIRARLADFGSTVSLGSSSDFGNLIANETEKWGKVIRAANIKPE